MARSGRVAPLPAIHVGSAGPPVAALAVAAPAVPAVAVVPDGWSGIGPGADRARAGAGVAAARAAAAIGLTLLLRLDPAALGRRARGGGEGVLLNRGKWVILVGI